MFQWVVPPGLPAGAAAAAAAGLPPALAAVPLEAGAVAAEPRVCVATAGFALFELLFAPPQAARKAADNPPSAVVPISRLRLIVRLHPRQSSAYRIGPSRDGDDVPLASA